MSQEPRGRVKGAHGLPLSSEAELVPPRSRAGAMRSRGLKDRYEGTGLENPSLAKNTGRLGHRKANKTLRDLLAWGTRRNTTSLPPSPPGLWYSGPLYPRVQTSRPGGPARNPGDRGETRRRWGQAQPRAKATWGIQRTLRGGLGNLSSRVTVLCVYGDPFPSPFSPKSKRKNLGEGTPRSLPNSELSVRRNTRKRETPKFKKSLPLKENPGKVRGSRDLSTGS